MSLNLWKPEAKRRAGIVRPAVVPGLSLSRYSNKELGVRIARRSNLPKQDPGVAWARLMVASDRPAKDAARDAVLRLFTRARFPDLSILTFPASGWLFESALLAMREGDYIARQGPRVTRISAIERDEAVYRAATHNIPRPTNARGQRRNAARLERVHVNDAPPFASASVRSAHISNFWRCHFEDYALQESGERGDGARYFNAAWLDFQGQLSPTRLNAIERFWTRKIRDVLVVTLLNARTSSWMTGLIQGAGGIEKLLIQRLAGACCEEATYYNDGAPMVQIVLRRESGPPITEAQTPKESR